MEKEIGIVVKKLKESEEILEKLLEKELDFNDECSITNAIGGIRKALKRLGYEEE